MQGPTEALILKQVFGSKAPIPKKIAEAPSLEMGLELYYAAFFDLIGCRSGMGDGPISWEAMAEYAKVYGFSDEQREDLFTYIGVMDAAYLKHARTKVPKG